MRVGLVGLGRMGNAMARRLSTFDIRPTCWDQSQQASIHAAAQGFNVVADPCAVALASDLILISITEDAGVRGLFTQTGGFGAADLRGKLFIEMSTLRPQTVRDLALQLEPLGAAIMDCPVLGTVPAAQDGTLVGLVGASDADFQRARPLLEKLTRACAPMGPVGAGHAMKLAFNLAMAAFINGVGEGLAMGAAQGLDLNKMMGVFLNSPLANVVLENKAANFLGEAAPLTLDIRTLRKDLQSALAAGASVGATMGATAAALGVLSSAVAAGWGDRDIGDLAPFLRDALTQKIPTCDGDACAG